MVSSMESMESPVNSQQLMFSSSSRESGRSCPVPIAIANWSESACGLWTPCSTNVSLSRPLVSARPAVHQEESYWRELGRVQGGWLPLNETAHVWGQLPMTIPHITVALTRGNSCAAFSKPSPTR